MSTPALPPDPEVTAGIARRRSPREIAELVATVLIALGVCMLVQPFALWLYTYSFIVTLAGTMLFIVSSLFPE